MRKEYERLADKHARAMVKTLTISNEAYRMQVDRLIEDNNALAADLLHLSAEKQENKHEQQWLQQWLIDALLDSRQDLKDAEAEMEAMENIIETLIDGEFENE